MTNAEQPSETTGRSNPAKALLTAIATRKAVFIPILALIAVVPWLIPWHQSVDASPTADPSAVIKQARDLQPSASPGSVVPTGPDDKSVADVTKELAKSAQSGYDLPVSKSEVASVSTKPGPYQKLGRLQIPKIGLDVSYGEGVFDETLLKGPGHWPGTPMPGRAGNSVLSGHRNTHTQPFKYLNVLKPGDEITATYGKEKSVTYKVTGTKIVPQAQYKDYVLRQPDKSGVRQITLFACHPEGNPIYRIVVQATASPTTS